MRWWQVFVDKLTGRTREDAAMGPRRRADVRYAYRASIEAKCSSWPAFSRLFTGDVSAHGMFVPTDQAAKLGERMEVKLTLPDGRTLAVTGTVVAIVDEATAARSGKPPGLGIKLDPFEPDQQAVFDELIALAKSDQPAPAAADEGFDIDVDEPSSAGPLPTPAKTEPARAATPAAAAPGKAAAALGKAAGKAGRIVGIDLGTTYTSVAAAMGNKVVLLPRPDGSRQTPSVVAFPSRDKIIVGAEAKRMIATDPKHAVQSPKRLLGRKYDDRTIESFLVQAAWMSERGPDDTVLIEMHGDKYAVTQLCAYILADARDAAEAALGERVDRCVLTVPVSFDEARMRLVRRAAQLARLEVVATIDEPSSAALANRFVPGFGGIVGVYDFGGGTFDFTLVDVSGGDFRVLATAGDAWLGGDDFDIAMADAVANQIQKMHHIDLRKQQVDWQRTLFACEQAKRQLTTQPTAEIRVPELLRTKDGMVDLSFRLDRKTFERIAAPVIDRSVQTCMDALALLDLKPNELSAIYLSGGTTYIPAVRAALAERFGVPVKTGVPPDHAVALGAGIHAAQLEAQVRSTLDQHHG